MVGVVAVLLAAVLLALHALTRPWAPPGAWVWREARVALPADPGQSPRTVRLPHILDDEGPAWWGAVRYELPWPRVLDYEQPAAARLALLMPRAGMRVRVLLNDQEIYQFGWDAAPERTVVGNAVPHYVPLPPMALASEAQANRLVVEVQARPLERSGLWPAVLGPQEVLQERHQSLLLWQVTGSWIMAALALFIGALALLLWRALRERLFLLIALASLAHGVRTVLVSVVEPPMPFEWLLLLRWSAFGVYVGFFVLTIEELFEAGLTWVRAGAWGVMVASPLMTAAALWTLEYDLIRLWAGAMTAFAAAALLRAVLERLRRRALQRQQQIVALVALFTWLTALRDFLVIQLNFPGDGDLRWMSVGSLVLTLTLGWVLVERAAGWARAVHKLNETLAQRIAQRERELSAAFERLQAAERQRAIEEERRRLMRDMHDGLGSQLVQTLNLVRNPNAQLDREALAGMLRQALDELRLTLDSFEPMEGDLPAILGTLRRRLGPALEGVGIELRWEVQDVPPLAALDSRGVLHLFRCLQEIFANVVKHARARRIVVSTWQRDEQVILTIEDDGVGLPPAEQRSPEGRGLRNVLTRAAKLGATVRFYDAHPGTGIEFAFPLRNGAQPPNSGWAP
ncbi:Signal transduction histidine-protein kinase/phosphatase UhpB [Tepidimonas alkaliphilus]|uniref:Signal transduction histidine-protein kinase/phosphatase UhpB n=1 Tax=Tepidimonas alkaliphilus TaxID=2588942 RepID=A0A554WAG7_9BURK|nr:ATP-binding protein [Tepidimonas alkaliphilus]TSE20558.1 Signal transduction histidine-protein kinase/phosphatase UhpB [Tepidimonas alkaliphilus]